MRWDRRGLRSSSVYTAFHHRHRVIFTVSPLLDKERSVFQESWNVCDGHEGHERTAEEDGIDKGLDIALIGLQAEPYGAHHHRQAHVHGDADAVGDDVAVRLDERAVDESHWNGERPGGSVLHLRVEIRVHGVARHLVRELIHRGGGEARLMPRRMDHVQLLVDLAPIAGEVGVDEIDDELGRVHVERDWEAAGIEVGLDFRYGTAVRGPALREQQELVEHGEGRGRRLMDRRDDDQIVLFRDVLDERDHLERRGGVQTRRRLVEEQQLRAGDELRGHADATLLATRDALPDGCSDEVVGLARQAEGGQEGFDALDALELADRAWEGEASGEVERLTNGERAHQRILLFDVRGDAAEGFRVGGGAVDVDGRLDRGVEGGRPMGKHVEERGLAGTAGPSLSAYVGPKGFPTEHDRARTTVP